MKREQRVTGQLLTSNQRKFIKGELLQKKDGELDKLSQEKHSNISEVRQQLNEIFSNLPKIFSQFIQDVILINEIFPLKNEVKKEQIEENNAEIVSSTQFFVSNVAAFKKLVDAKQEGKKHTITFGNSWHEALNKAKKDGGPFLISRIYADDAESDYLKQLVLRLMSKKHIKEAKTLIKLYEFTQTRRQEKKDTLIKIEKPLLESMRNTRRALTSLFNLGLIGWNGGIKRKLLPRTHKKFDLKCGKVKVGGFVSLSRYGTLVGSILKEEMRPTATGTYENHYNFSKYYG